MKSRRLTTQLLLVIACAAMLACTALAAQTVTPAAPRVYVAGAAASLIEQGLALPAPTGPDAATFQVVPPPSVRNVPNVANATSDPWIDSNAWRFHRGMQRASYVQLPAGSAGLAAAEAFTFGMDAILNADPADLAELGQVLRFLKAHDQPRMPRLVNIGIVDDGTPAMGEVLNMLTRRNLLYRVVAQPDRRLNLTVQLGTPDFPKDAASNPSEFAARVRAKLGDDNRLVRLYGTTTAIVHLTGAEARARLYVLSYSRNRNQTGLRIRLARRYETTGFAAYGATSDSKVTDLKHPGKTTEFSLPAFSTIAIVDLTAIR
jgi:hypothetical protein